MQARPGSRGLQARSDPPSRRGAAPDPGIGHVHPHLLLRRDACEVCLRQRVRPVALPQGDQLHAHQAIALPLLPDPEWRYAHVPSPVRRARLGVHPGRDGGVRYVRDQLALPAHYRLAPFALLRGLAPVPQEPRQRDRGLPAQHRQVGRELRAQGREGGLPPLPVIHQGRRSRRRAPARGHGEAGPYACSAPPEHGAAARRGGEAPGRRAAQPCRAAACHGHAQRGQRRVQVRPVQRQQVAVCAGHPPCRLEDAARGAQFAPQRPPL